MIVHAFKLLSPFANRLSPASIFTVVTLFSILRLPLTAFLPYAVERASECNVSLKRMTQYVHHARMVGFLHVITFCGRIMSSSVIESRLNVCIVDSCYSVRITFGGSAVSGVERRVLSPAQVKQTSRMIWPL